MSLISTGYMVEVVSYIDDYQDRQTIYLDNVKHDEMLFLVEFLSNFYSGKMGDGYVTKDTLSKLIDECYWKWLGKKEVEQLHPSIQLLMNPNKEGAYKAVFDIIGQSDKPAGTKWNIDASYCRAVEALNVSYHGE